MSARADLQALLAATTAVTALVGDRIAADRIEQTDARPFIVYTTTATNRTRGLDGTLHGVQTSFELQVWADTRLQADAVGDAVQAAVETAQHFVTNRASGYDADLDLEASILSIDWWE